MLFTDAVYVGIDPTAGDRPIPYAALDKDLRLIALDQDDMEAVLAFVGGLEVAIVGVDAPQSPNQGLMADPEFRRRFNLRPNGRTWRDWRVCEYELRQRNIRLYNTPGDENKAPGWVRNGFALFRRLRTLGYKPYYSGEKPGLQTFVEARPHACFTMLLEHRPFLKRSLEGRLQRQLLLYLEGLDLPNPMYALEEITRHHLLSGNLPLDRLHEHEQLDVLICAYTAYLVAQKPERVSQVGDPNDGWITLPVKELKDFYP